MRDNTKFRNIVQKTVTCKKCEDCYKPNDPTLVYSAGEKADVVLISESPYNFPKEIKPYTLEDHMRGLSAVLTKVRDEGQDARIHEFIFRTFTPLFESRLADMGVAFSEKVYWTHAAKKSLKCVKNRMKAARKCAEKLVIEELAAIEPKLLVIVSGIATEILFGLGFKVLYDQHISLDGELLEFRRVLDMSAPKSLMRQSTDRFTSNWRPTLAVLPNPSGAAGRWHKYAYKTNAMVADNVRKRIWENLRS
jgi:hypothetical protein